MHQTIWYKVRLQGETAGWINKKDYALACPMDLSEGEIAAEVIRAATSFDPFQEIRELQWHYAGSLKMNYIAFNSQFEYQTNGDK